MKQPVEKMCAYCRKFFPQGKLTKDHIPPKGMYGKKWRKGKDLPWVDCCYECRKGQSLGDEALKTLVGLGVYRMPEVDRISDESLRAIERPSWVRKQMKAALPESKEIMLFGRLPAMVMPMTPAFSKEVHEAVRRIVIAILFDWDPHWDSHLHNFKIIGRNEQDLREIHEVQASLIRDLRYGRDYGEGVIAARWDFAVDREGYGFFALTFYGTQAFFVMIRRKGDAWPGEAVCEPSLDMGT